MIDLNLSTLLIYSILAYALYWIYTIIYSIFLSPLKDIPAPWQVHVWPFMFRIQLILTGKIHKQTLDLHKRYGKVVRFGPNSLSYSTDENCKDIYSTYTYSKSEFFSAFDVIGETIFSTRKKDYHRQRKKIIAPSFSEKSMLDLEPLVKKSINQLVDEIKKLANDKKSFDIGKYFSFTTFDVIGDLAFGKSFGMIRSGSHPISGWIKQTFTFISLVSVFPFLKFYQPSYIKELYKFSYEAIKNSKQHPDRNTVLNSLLNAKDPETNQGLSEKEIAEESIVQLIAGTDSTSNSLTWVMYYLTKHPEIYTKLQTELRSQFPDKDNISYTQCKANCDYLSAVLYETLRIMPVIAGNLARVVPKGGKVIDNHFIPENTNIGVSINVLHNLPSNWEDPEQFKPERWIDENGKFKNNPNFMPFMMGPRACVGRTLAWMELYLIISNIVYNFNMKLNNSKDVDSKFNIVVSPEESIIVTPSLTLD